MEMEKLYVSNPPLRTPFPGSCSVSFRDFATCRRARVGEREREGRRRENGGVQETETERRGRKGKKRK